MKRGIVIPTYNESTNIEPLITECFKLDPELHFIVVDDSSPDGTGKVVEGLVDRYPERVKLLTQPSKMGLGAAYVKGISAGLEAGWDCVCEMDADHSHQPKYLKDLFHWIKSFDLVMGSRYISGGGVVNWNFYRRMLSRYGNLYARMVLGVGIRDLTSGFRCYRREVIESIGLKEIKSNGYSFQIETAYRTHLQGFRIKETPIVFVERLDGSSKMSKTIVREAIGMVWKLRFQRKRLKVPHRCEECTCLDPAGHACLNKAREERKKPPTKKGLAASPQE